MKTSTVTTKKKNELYEYAKKLGFEFDEWKFSQKGDIYFQAFKKRTFEVNGQEYHVQHKLHNCLYTAGQHVISITTTIYNKKRLYRANRGRYAHSKPSRYRQCTKRRGKPYRVC